jgi:hypothetical protein
MKSIGGYKEAKILKLFLGGFSYDEIAQQVGVSHGSVANTVDEFRNGDLFVPPGMTEYVDELRHLVVDMKKEHTTPAQVKSCLNIHKKLLKMGVDTTQAEQWLDISQDIASTADSDKQFVESALELAQLTGDTGLSCKAAVDSYHAMMKASEALDIDMQQKSKKLEVFDLNYEKKKKQASKELESINTAIATAQDNFAQQEAQLKAQMDEYLAQNKLTWKKVKTATALLDSGLADAGLNKEEIEELSERLEAAGSLAVTINELKKQRDELKPEVELLAKQKGDYSDIVGQLQECMPI